MIGDYLFQAVVKRLGRVVHQVDAVQRFDLQQLLHQRLPLARGRAVQYDGYVQQSFHVVFGIKKPKAMPRA